MSKHRLIPFLVILFVVAVPLGFVSVSAQQADYYELSLVPEHPYYLRGETAQILVRSNASTTVTLEVWNPDDVLLTSQQVTTDENGRYLWNVTVPLNAVYGTYTVKGYVGEAVSETWVTVVENENWVTPTFPWTKQHKGVTYTIYANRTFHAKSTSGELSFSVPEIPDKVDVSAQVNSMAFKATFTFRILGQTATIDWYFVFIHSGCKMVFTGSLPKPSTFTFKFYSPKQIKKYLDRLSDGYLTFDWSDLRKAGEYFTYNHETHELTVSVPAQFRLDPTIFEDGFESGDFSAWTGTNTTLDYGYATVETTNPHHGTYSAKFEILAQAAWTSANSYKEYTAQATVFTRIYLYVDAFTPGAGAVQRAFIRYGGTARIAAEIGLTSGRALQLRYWNDPTSSYVQIVSSTVLSLDTWYSVELKTIISATAGECRVWVDGSEITDLTVTGIDNDGAGNIDTTIVGIVTSYNLAAVEFVDCVVVADTYIGPETANNPPVNQQVVIDNMDDTNYLYSKKRAYNFVANWSDPDGLAELDFGKLNFTDGLGGWIVIRVDLQSNEGVIESGADYVSLGTITNTTSGNSAQYTIPVTLDWDIGDASNIEIYMWCNDTIGDTDPASGFEELQTNYANIESDIVIYSATASDTRCDISSSQSISGQIYYEGSTSVYPPSSENIIVYENVTSQSAVMDNTGGYSISITASSSVANTTYLIYANTTITAQNQTVWIVSDRVDINTFSVSDDRIDIGTSADFTVAGIYEYDSTTWSGTYALNDTTTKNTVGKYGYSVSSITDNNYGLTAFQQSAPDLSVIFDRLEFVSVTANDTRIDVSASFELRYQIRYDYDDVTFDDTKGSISGFTWDSANSWWEKTVTGSSSVASTNYDETYVTITDSTYGLTVKQDVSGVNVITDRINVYWWGSNDTRLDWNNTSEIRVKLVLDYDEHPLGSGDTVSVNGTSATWDSVNGWFEITDSYGSSVEYVYSVSSATEADYGITAINHNVTRITINWDRVQVSFSVDDSTPNNNVAVTFTVTLTYESDGDAVGSYTYDINRNGTLFKDDWTTSTFTDSASDTTYVYDFVSMVDNSNGIQTFVDPPDLTVKWSEAAVEYATKGFVLSVGVFGLLSLLMVGLPVLMMTKRRR